jgi:catechol 2,3-dioxygenase-like lactoylglutathione lyase family enzyme
VIGYVSVGTNDLPRAAAFYDALLAEIGAKRLLELPRGLMWGVAWDKPSLAVLTPFDGQPATVGTGCTARRSSSAGGTRDRSAPAVAASTPATSATSTATS